MTDEKALATQRWIWSLGDYGALAQRLLPVSVDLLDTVGVRDGDRLLDVGVGDGNAAIEAARRGAVVTGVDLTPEQLELARARAASEGVAVDLREGNAEDLPFADASFDTVVSVMGVVFAPDHARAAAELARVCRPGGTVAMTAWTHADGWHKAWRERAEKLVPPPPAGTPGPDDWGDEAELTRRLSQAGLSVRIEQRSLRWTFDSLDDAADFYLNEVGPYLAFQQAAASAGHGPEVVRATLLEVMEPANLATDGTCRFPAPYLLAVATR